MKRVKQRKKYGTNNLNAFLVKKNRIQPPMPPYRNGSSNE